MRGGDVSSEPGALHVDKSDAPSLGFGVKAVSGMATSASRLAAPERHRAACVDENERLRCGTLNPGAPEGQTGCDTQTEFCSKTTENERWTWYLSVRQCTQQSDCGNPANPAEVDCVGGLCAARSLHGDYDLPYGVCLPKGSVPEHNFCDRPGDCADDQYCTNGPFCVDLSAGCESIDDCSDAMRCEEDAVCERLRRRRACGTSEFCEDRPQDKSNGCVGATCRNTTTCLATELSAGRYMWGMSAVPVMVGATKTTIARPGWTEICRFRGFSERSGMGAVSRSTTLKSGTVLLPVKSELNAASPGSASLPDGRELLALIPIRL